MTEATYTPGPWTACRPQANGTSVIAPFGVEVAWCGCNATSGLNGSYRIDELEAAANARLSAAAPDLLAVAKFLTNFMPKDAPEARYVQSVIAKAEGRS